MMRIFADVKSVKRIDTPEIEPGSWVEVRVELSVGERNDIFSKAMKGQTDLGNGQTRNEYDFTRLTLGLIAGHLSDWNYTDEVDGKQVPIECNYDGVAGLSQPAFNILEQIIDKHVKGLRKEPGESKPAKRNAKGPVLSSVAG